MALLQRQALAWGLAFMCLATNAQPKASQTPIEPATLGWMQAVLDNWAFVSQRELRVAPGPLPWIIFYDEAAAWHVRPDTRMLPSGNEHPSSASLRFNGQPQPLIRIEHQGGKLWVPGRPPLDPAVRPVATMPYDDGRQSFFVVPLPSVFHRLAPPVEAPILDELFLGLAAHELTHTLQLPSAMPRLTALRARYPLPESLDDNAIEQEFHASADYIKAYEAERALWTAAILAGDLDDTRKLVRQGLAANEQRRARFFVGDKAGYAGLEDVFLSMEGTAMWVQFRTARARASASEEWIETLRKLSARHDAWSQEQGLGLCLLLDRLMPAWQSRLLSPAFPSPLALLREAVGSA